MVIPTWAIWIIGLIFPIIVSFWGWLAVNVIDAKRKIVELEVKFGNQEKNCEERLCWIRKIDEKVDALPDKIIDQLETFGVIGRKGVKDEDN